MQLTLDSFCNMHKDAHTACAGYWEENANFWVPAAEASSKGRQKCDELKAQLDAVSVQIRQAEHAQHVQRDPSPEPLPRPPSKLRSVSPVPPAMHHPGADPADLQRDPSLEALPRPPSKSRSVSPVALAKSQPSSRRASPSERAKPEFERAKPSSRLANGNLRAKPLPRSVSPVEAANPSSRSVSPSKGPRGAAGRSLARGPDSRSQAVSLSEAHGSTHSRKRARSPESHVEHANTEQEQRGSKQAARQHQNDEKISPSWGLEAGATTSGRSQNNLPAVSRLDVDSTAQHSTAGDKSDRPEKLSTAGGIQRLKGGAKESEPETNDASRAAKRQKHGRCGV